MALEADERAHRHAEPPDLLRPAQVRQIDDETGRQNVGAHLLQQLAGGFRRAAGGDEIIDQDDALVFENGVLVHLHLVDAVFEGIADGHALERQLAFLADGDEAGRDLMGDGAAENEPARLDAGNLVDLAARPGLHQLVDGAAEGPRVAQERGDVAKHDARLRIVRDVADRGLEIALKRNAGHGRSPVLFTAPSDPDPINSASHHGPVSSLEHDPLGKPVSCSSIPPRPFLRLSGPPRRTAACPRFPAEQTRPAPEARTASLPKALTGVGRRFQRLAMLSLPRSREYSGAGRDAVSSG